MLFLGLWALALCGLKFVWCGCVFFFCSFCFAAVGFPTFAKANFTRAGLISQTGDSQRRGLTGQGQDGGATDKVNTTQLPHSWWAIEKFINNHQGSRSYGNFKAMLTFSAAAAGGGGNPIFIRFLFLIKTRQC